MKPWVPCALSFIRGILGIVAPVLLFHPNKQLHLLAGGIFVFAVLTDYWDGLLARKYNADSDFGKILDPLMDKILILAALTVFAMMGFYSPWWLVPVFIREIAASFLRAGWMREGKAVGAEKIGKVKFFFQAMTSVAAYVYFLSFDFNFSKIAQLSWYWVMMGLLIISVVMTVVSGITFIRTNWVHCQSEKFAQFASSLSVGFLPKAPGTWGTLLGVAVFFLVQWNFWLHLSVLAFFIWFGYWAVSRMDLKQNKDPHFVVVDETCGILITLLGFQGSFLYLIVAFIAFRLFDIFKPFPLRRLERLPGYWGILCDDLGAGVYAWLIVRLVVPA